LRRDFHFIQQAAIFNIPRTECGATGPKRESYDEALKGLERRGDRNAQGAILRRGLNDAPGNAVDKYLKVSSKPRMSTRLVIVTHVVKADTDTVVINVSIATTVDGDLKQFDRQKSKLEHEGDWEKKAISVKDELCRKAMAFSAEQK
jgi:hypothetical protein